MAAELTQAETAQYYSYFQSVKKDIVKPERVHHHPSRIYPSNLDILQPNPARYVPILFAYRLADTSDTFYNQFVLGLKQSLAKVLVLFYPAAGGLAGTSDLHHPLVFVCDDRGVPFIEAYKDEQMDEIVKDHEPEIPLSGLQAVGLFSNKDSREIPESGIPCVVVQITRFKCGGVSIAVTWNHTLADMAGGMLLIKAWADVACKGETTVAPHIDRTVLSPTRANEIQLAASLSSVGNMWRAVGSLSNPGMVRMKVLHISRDKIGMVKQSALEDGYVVSTLDCISAHLWRCVTKHGATSTGTDVRSLMTTVEGRARMSETLTSNYFGNVLSLASVRKIPRTEILSRPLAYTASLIRKAIQEITEETYWEMINEIEKVLNNWSSNDDYLTINLLISSWTRFGMYDVDFGSGIPLRFQPNYLPEVIRHGQCLIVPSNPSAGGFDVLMYFHSGSGLHERLWADPEFISLS
ncbi:hypothetical protein R1sor_025392 [Riccia sorocarpa]|uniref:Uncharacterized protein n=1 Tax=Riccia sorocarpa TaxID=122646 RepID=A0ABD3GCF0_9MARC